jgi:hypothetical protein
MFHLRKLFAAAALATVALFAAPGQQAQAATTDLMSNQTAVIGDDYTFNTTIATPTSVPIGPMSYAFTFAPVNGGANAMLKATFTYIQLSGALTGGYITWGNGVRSSLTQALVAGTDSTVGTLIASIPLSAAGPSRTLTVGFEGQSGTTILGGGVSVTAIPLPASGLLLLAGLGAIAVVRRRAAKLAA